MSKPYILVVRQLGGIGDVISLSTVIRGLKEKYPKHTIKYVTAAIYLGGALTDIAEHNPLIDEVIVIEPYEGCSAGTRDVWAQYYGGCPAIENELLWQRADKAICLNTACVNYEWGQLKAGLPIEKPRYQIWCEAADVVPSSYAPIYKVTPKERSVARSYFTQKGWVRQVVVGVGCAACDPKRGISLDKTKEICEGLKAIGIKPVTIDNILKIDGVEAIVGTRIKDLMPLIEQMDAMISVDSGPIHMAGAVDVPVIGIFGPTDYRMRMGNYMGVATDSTQLMPCAPCWYNYPCRQEFNPDRQYECLKKIAPEVVVEETRRLLQREGKLDA
jgi:ADP-heptose:LPS heptosyltransferase